MTTHLTISILFVLGQLSSNGQTSFPSKVFHKHFQSCHMVGTTEDDFVILLNNDSTIKITTYTSNYRDQYNSVTRQEYNGTYSTFGDTIKIIFTDHSSLTKSKIQKASSTSHINQVDRYFQYPPKTYIVSDNTINSIDNIFPTLNKGTITKGVLLDSKFNNWDKEISYKKEIFGLAE